MHRIQIYIEEEPLKKVRKESEILGVSISEFIKMSIKENSFIKLFLNLYNGGTRFFYNPIVNAEIYAVAFKNKYAAG